MECAKTGTAEDLVIVVSFGGDISHLKCFDGVSVAVCLDEDCLKGMVPG